MRAPSPQLNDQLQLLRQHWPVYVAGCSILLILLALFVGAAVHYFLKLRYSTRTWRLALVYILAALPLPVVNAILLFSRPASQLPQPHMAPFLRFGAIIGVGVAAVIALAAGLAFTAAGMYYSVRLRQPHFPLLRALARRRRRPPLPAARRSPWILSVAVGAGFLLYTVALFWATEPRISPVLKHTVQTLELLMERTGSPLLVAILVSLIAVKEEVTYRLFIQTQFEWWLRRTSNPACWAILLSATVWTLGHAGAIEPTWVKFAQIFPMGIALGLMRRRWGLTPCIVAHVMLNFIGVLMLEDLVT